MSSHDPNIAAAYRDLPVLRPKPDRRKPSERPLNPAALIEDSAERSSFATLADKLQRSQAQYRSLVDSMDLGYILVDVIVDDQDAVLDLRYVDANAKAVTMTGTELVGRTTRELSPDFEPHWFETFGRVARTGVGERHELPAGPLNVWYDFYVFKVGERDTRLVVALYQDITQRKQAEKLLRDSEERLRRAHEEMEQRVRQRTAELAQSNAALEAELHERRAAEDQVKALFARLVTAQEDERRRIALDIHDRLGQQMTALRLQVEALHRGCEAQPVLADAIGRARQLAYELDQSVDFLTWELSPAALDQLGLDDALDQLVVSWSERCGTPAAFDVLGARAQRLHPDVETNLFRLSQEALDNIHKHAGAASVSVALEHRDAGSVLTIVDDGRGFDVAEARHRVPGGSGLVGMRERAALAGGDLQIESSGRGTIVRVVVPAALD